LNPHTLSSTRTPNWSFCEGIWLYRGCSYTRWRAICVESCDHRETTQGDAGYLAVTVELTTGDGMGFLEDWDLSYEEGEISLWAPLLKLRVIMSVHPWGVSSAFRGG
jgi:hypothetical protein